MTMRPHSNLDPALYPEGSVIEHAGSAVAWSAIWALATIVVVGIAVLVSSLSSVSAPPDTVVTVVVTDLMRKAAAFAIYSAIAMLVGAFIASVAAGIGGGIRDRHP